jgi:hypothetical protein
VQKQMRRLLAAVTIGSSASRLRALLASRISTYIPRASFSRASSAAIAS